VHLDGLIQGLQNGNVLATEKAVERLSLMERRHKLAVRGGKAVCGNCSRGHDMRALVLWPCAEYRILSGMTDEVNPALETFRPGID
jgi:hypothetical protein